MVGVDVSAEAIELVRQELDSLREGADFGPSDGGKFDTGCAAARSKVEVAPQG